MTEKKKINQKKEIKTKISSSPSSCPHHHLVPLEVSFIRITYPNGYKESAKCEFYVSISLATAFRVRKFFCSACGEIIKAPSIYTEETI